MDNPSKDAAAFIRKLAEVAYRLAAREIVVSSLHADWSSFGSWELQAQRSTEATRYAEAILNLDPTRAPGPEVIRVCWDGREGILSVQTSPTRFLCAPNDWKEECSKGFDRMDDQLFQFVEDYIHMRLGV
jgi:hypothetical protein